MLCFTRGYAPGFTQRLAFNVWRSTFGVQRLAFGGAVRTSVVDAQVK
jgi:hypothetical protein